MSWDTAWLDDWLAILAAGAFDRWPGRVHADAVFRFPFAPAGMATELVGRDAAVRALSAMKADPSFAYRDVVRIATREPGLVIATMSATADGAGGAGYRNDYVMMVRFLDGLVVEHVEYFNPVPVLAAMARA